MALKAFAISSRCLCVFRNGTCDLFQFAIGKSGTSFRGSIAHAQPNQVRTISTTKFNRVKEIVETTTGNTIVIEGVYLESDRKDSLLEQPQTTPTEGKACPLCRLNLDLHHTDVLILNQFLTPTGHLLPERITGLCSKQQALVKNLADQAEKAGK